MLPGVSVVPAAAHRSFIPLSKAGIQYGSSAQWGSIYGGDFKDKHVDLTANHAMAQAVGAMFNGGWRMVTSVWRMACCMCMGLVV